MISADEILIDGQGLVPIGATRELAPLSISVRSGTVTCFVGPDGSGKSHYLRALAGIDAVRAGQLTLLGHSAYNLGQEDWRQMRTKIGFLGSDTPLLSFLSGWRNVLFSPLYHRLAAPAELEAKAHQLIAALAIDADLEELPAYLDDLAAHKLTIVRALMLDPVVLFLDEPFRRFDTCSIRPVNKFLLDRVRERGMGLVIATHDLSLVSQYADQVIFCSGGNLRVFTSGLEMVQSSFADVREYVSQTTGEVKCDDE
ncbi:MAG: ATP-binding cassette domain-containing protein [Desulfobulbaceae bacterium]|nr:ATP-binding cassette domain-containing protein [Desulfobulbaceae bacterium]